MLTTCVSVLEHFFFHFDSFSVVVVGDKEKEVGRGRYYPTGCSHLVIHAFIFFIHCLLRNLQKLTDPRLDHFSRQEGFQSALGFLIGSTYLRGFPEI